MRSLFTAQYFRLTKTNIVFFGGTAKGRISNNQRKKGRKNWAKKRVFGIWPNMQMAESQ
jgi:hypothetical protein